MKKQILFLAAAIVAAASVAQTSHTVSNNPANPAQFTEIQEAINAASDGDTIYVAGSNINYGNVLVNKRVVLIGAGYVVTGANARTVVTQIDISSTVDNGGGSGSIITGFIAEGNLVGDPDQIISDVIIERNLFTGNDFNANFGKNENWFFRNNIVYQTNTNTFPVFNCASANNLTVQNNIFQGESSLGTNKSWFGLRSSNSIVTNNVYFDYVLEFDDALVTNNIFIQQNFTDRSVVSSNATYNNNIFFGENVPDGSNTFNNNIFNNPGFVSEDNSFYSFGEDLNLTAASPGKNAGTDGTDIGVFGGNFPMVFEPANPEITQLLINTVQVPVGGELEFTIQAEGRQ